MKCPKKIIRSYKDIIDGQEVTVNVYAPWEDFAEAYEKAIRARINGYFDIDEELEVLLEEFNEADEV